MIITERLDIVAAIKDDIHTIMTIENHPDNRDFIWQGSYDQHLEEIEDEDHLLLLFKRKDNKAIVGYCLIHQDFHSHVFELRRIAIVDKGQGYGEESMKSLIKYAFEETETNRFWLDVYPDNHAGIALYEKLGMHRDGILRQSYKSHRGYLDQIIYSILRSEYQL